MAGKGHLLCSEMKLTQAEKEKLEDRRLKKTVQL